MYKYIQPHLFVFLSKHIFLFKTQFLLIIKIEFGNLILYLTFCEMGHFTINLLISVARGTIVPRPERIIHIYFINFIFPSLVYFLRLHISFIFIHLLLKNIYNSSAITLSSIFIIFILVKP